MIHVARGPAPKALSPAAVRREVGALKEIYGPMRIFYPKGRKPPGGAGDGAFALYREKGVKEALARIFQRKCAYCEMGLPRLKMTHVEHYRPKAHVDVKGAGRWVPGYYDWAARWENLLPACAVCNSSYKRNLFPVVDEKARFSPRERPLLLDPCRERRPENHLEFGVENLSSFVRGRTESGRVSVDGYGLMEEDLVWERTRVLRQFCRRWCEFEEDLREREEKLAKGEAAAGALARSLKRVKAEIARMIEPDHPYAGMLRQLKDFFLGLVRKRESVAAWFARELREKRTRKAARRRRPKSLTARRPGS